MTTLVVLLSAMLLAGEGPVEADLTPDERALLTELDGEHFIKARDLAEKLLAGDPRSFLATWALARVHHDEEGNHARALFYLKRAEALLGDRDREWGKKLLLEEYFILQEMNRNDEAIAVLDEHARRFGPPASALRIWPLIKAGRHEEARDLSTRLAASNDFQERLDGFNGLLTVAFEEHDREGTYRWAVQGVDATGGESCTLLRNAASSSFSRFKLDEAESYLLRASKKTRDCVDPADNQLATLYLLEGEFQKALSALEAARGKRIEKRYRPQFALGKRATLVDLLIVFGKPAEAVTMAADLYSQQTRTGMTSGSDRIERLSRTLRYGWALDGQVTALAEQVATAELPRGPFAPLAELTRLEAVRWEVRQGLVQLLAEEQRLELMARPNSGEMSDWASWRFGDLAEVVGTGTLRSALERARLADAPFPEATSYFDALEAELAWREGWLSEADRLSDQAMKTLPRQEALWRWRTLAFRADVLRRLGRSTEARAAYQEVLSRWPTALRLLGLALPVKLEVAAGEPADKTATRLSRSPRFAISNQAPFVLRVELTAQGIEICLRDDSGAQLACAEGDRPDTALEAFSSAAFSPRISLTQSDLRSLDGSPVRVGADQALKKVLGQ